MALREHEIRVNGRDGIRQPGNADGGPSLGELFGQLSADVGQLISQEMTLAKAELRETGSALAKDAAKLGVAAALGLVGLLAATAFVILALGDLLDNYWLSALIVTVVYLVVAAVLAKGAMADLKTRSVKPERTVATLREDAKWAKREVSGIKREWTSQPH